MSRLESLEFEVTSTLVVLKVLADTRYLKLSSTGDHMSTYGLPVVKPTSLLLWEVRLPVFDIAGYQSKL